MIQTLIAHQLGDEGDDEEENNFPFFIFLSSFVMVYNCPWCGYWLDVTMWAVSLVCKYCKTISLIERWNLVNTGEKSTIMPFPTIFSVGKYFYGIKNLNSNDTFAWEKVCYISEEDFRDSEQKDFILKLYIYGQIRYINDGWFWDDYFVRIIESSKEIDKNKEYILTENEWLIQILYIKKIHSDVPQNVFDTQVWTTWNWFFVQESGNTKIEGFEWSFPFLVSIKDNSKYVVLLKEWKTTALKSIWNDVLEYSGI